MQICISLQSILMGSNLPFQILIILIGTSPDTSPDASVFLLNYLAHYVVQFYVIVTYQTFHLDIVTSPQRICVKNLFHGFTRWRNVRGATFQVKLRHLHQTLGIAQWNRLFIW